MGCKVSVTLAVIMGCKVSVTLAANVGWSVSAGNDISGAFEHATSNMKSRIVPVNFRILLDDLYCAVFRFCQTN